MKNNQGENSPSIKKNTLFNVIKTISSIIFPIITFPYISRVLRAENVGKINFGNSIVSYFSLIATLGVTTYAVRECSRVKNDKNLLGKIASQIISINICTMAFSYFILILCLMFIPVIKDYELLILIQSVSIIFTTLGADWLNTAMEDFKYITLRTFIFQFLALISMFLFVHKPDHYLIYAIISVLSSSGANITNIFYRRRYCKVRFTMNMNWKRHFPPIILLFAMLLSQNLLNNLDTTMLGIMKGDYQVGLYTTAVKIINIVSQVVASIAWVVMPQLSYQFAQKNYNKINKLLHDASAFTVALGLPCIVGINVSAPEIIEIIGGQEYLSAVPCLHILTISMAIGFLNGIYGNMILLPSKREKRFMIACLVSAGVNMVTNYIFIPYFGINAASAMTVLSSMVITIIVTSGIEKDIKFGNIMEMFKAPLMGSLGIIVIAIISKSLISNFWIKIFVVVACSITFYVAVLIGMKNEFAMSMLIPIIQRLSKTRRRKSTL
ncbi:flippase [Clostridium ljungdahlii]|uniref:Putative O-antigen transporter n=1 Tax=Clostridium ljungdahlii TaxID=1538 RepID=A0A168NV26_9CLOT|nr:flippase [Clostridium ljungdahlii]OAA86945.1 putative O-antigen transporter [Clostridium ljungdahlii]